MTRVSLFHLPAVSGFPRERAIFNPTKLLTSTGTDGKFSPSKFASAKTFSKFSVIPTVSKKLPLSPRDLDFLASSRFFGLQYSPGCTIKIPSITALSNSPSRSPTGKSRGEREYIPSVASITISVRGEASKIAALSLLLVRAVIRPAHIRLEYFGLPTLCANFQYKELMASFMG